MYQGVQHTNFSEVALFSVLSKGHSFHVVFGLMTNWKDEKEAFNILDSDCC